MCTEENAATELEWGKQIEKQAESCNGGNRFFDAKQITELF